MSMGKGVLFLRASLPWVVAAMASTIFFERELPPRPLNESFFLRGAEPAPEPKRDPKREPDDSPTLVSHRV
jgi:hypothetical protein